MPDIQVESRGAIAKVRGAARAAAQVAAKGLPAMRAAMHGARLGAGKAFSPAVIEALGVSVVPMTAKALATSIGRGAGEAAIVLERGGSVVKAGMRELVVHGKEGMTLRVSPTGGAVATVSGEAVLAMARTGVRGAVRGIGRAALGGAAAGALVDAGFAGLDAARELQRGEIGRRAAAKKVGLHAARGAVSGVAGVAAAGIVSAGIAATGLTIVGAPVAIPIATMVAAGAMTSKWFDRRFGTR